MVASEKVERIEAERIEKDYTSGGTALCERRGKPTGEVHEVTASMIIQATREMRMVHAQP